MGSSDLSKNIEDLYQHFEKIRSQCISDPTKTAELLSGALEDLRISLEELLAAEEEIYQQNEELIEAAGEHERHLRKI
jgi:hypothetical protein